MSSEDGVGEQTPDEQLLSGVRYDYRDQETKDREARDKEGADYRTAVAAQAAIGQRATDREVEQGYRGIRAGARPGERPRQSFPGGFFSTLASIAGTVIGGPVGMGLRVLSGFSTAGSFLSDRAKKAGKTTLDLERTAAGAGRSLKEQKRHSGSWPSLVGGTGKLEGILTRPISQRDLKKNLGR